MEEKMNNVVETEVKERAVDLTGISAKDLTKEIARRGKTKAKSGASRAKKWVLRVLAIGAAAGGGMAVGYHMKQNSEDNPVVMYPEDDGTTSSTTVGEILNDSPTEDEN